MNRIACEDCHTPYFSAAARMMVARGERCPICDGQLVAADGPRPVPRTSRERDREPEPAGRTPPSTA